MGVLIEIICGVYYGTGCESSNERSQFTWLCSPAESGKFTTFTRTVWTQYKSHPSNSWLDTVVKSVRALASQAEGQAVESRPSKMNDLQNWCLLLPSLALNSNRIEQNIRIVAHCAAALVFCWDSTIRSPWPCAVKTCFPSWYDLHSAAPLGNQAGRTMTWYPTQSHYSDTEPTSSCPILIMLNAK